MWSLLRHSPLVGSLGNTVYLSIIDLVVHNAMRGKPAKVKIPNIIFTVFSYLFFYLNISDFFCSHATSQPKEFRQGFACMKHFIEAYMIILAWNTNFSMAKYLCVNRWHTRRLALVSKYTILPSPYTGYSPIHFPPSNNHPPLSHEPHIPVEQT